MGMGTGDIDVTLENCVTAGGNRIYFKWDGGAGIGNGTNNDINTCATTHPDDASMYKVLNVASNAGNYSIDVYVGRFTGNILVD